MDMNDVSNKISKNTKAVIPVHMLGMPCNMDALMALKEKHGFYIIEDCAQADGGSYHGKRLGAYGECGAFSFNYYKIISCGEGGAVITNDDKLFQRAIIYHDVGTTFWGHYEQQEITEPPFSGITMRVSEIQGAIMRVQLKRLDGILKDLRKVKKQIIEGVKNTAIKLNPSNDMAGDCGTILSLFFNTVSAAEKFEQAITAAEVACTRPINTGKHVYSAWTPVLEKRGAYITSMDPYFNPKNKNLNMDVTEKSCPKTLDYLSRTVYLWLHPDWDDAEVNKKIEALKNAAKVIQE
jgi:dTDP-4-amino-4,6-dideoxygalactose transaminase